MPEETGRMILEKYWWVINSRDDQGKTALDNAKQANALWLSLKTQLIMMVQHRCTVHWRERICFLAKVLLLDDGVKRTIADHNGRTSMHLLAKLCKDNDDWGKMCKLIKVNPYLKTSYIQPGTNLDQIRNTLLVVSALLPTITFAAGFTLPGGIDSNNGEALLAKHAAFLVILLADVYAMCTSMLVLFCLIWSMVSEPDMARLLVDRSVFILMQSLYATLLAFMTGVYTVIAHRSLWAAILIPGFFSDA